MTHIFTPDPSEREKWRAQARKAAEHLKQVAVVKDELKLGFAFDDGVITVTINAQQIRDLGVDQLTDHIYELVLSAAQPKQLH